MAKQWISELCTSLILLSLLAKAIFQSYCDAAFQSSSSSAAVGCVLFNREGRISDGVGFEVKAPSSLVAKLSV